MKCYYCGYKITKGYRVKIVIKGKNRLIHKDCAELQIRAKKGIAELCKINS